MPQAVRRYFCYGFGNAVVCLCMVVVKVQSDQLSYKAKTKKHLNSAAA